MAERRPLRLGTIVVVGGGCYGAQYVRLLARGRAAGALAWDRVVVVDRDPSCAVTALAAPTTAGAELVVDTWERFLAAWLPGAGAGDTIVPSPLQPHLLFDWLAARATARWPGRTVGRAPLGLAPPTPWERTAPDGTHYASFATWTCPINCIEPATCPHTRGPRTWTMPRTLAAHAPAAGCDTSYVFACTHRAYGVGMIDAAALPAADADLAARGARGPVRALVATSSHCHAAVAVLQVE